jgi:hypothetical protein
LLMVDSHQPSIHNPHCPLSLEGTPSSTVPSTSQIPRLLIHFTNIIQRSGDA